ncbi:MAG: hypothetical protein WD907_07095 [Bacilli bacterium]
MSSAWKTRWITAFIVLIMTIVASLFFDQPSRLLAITNVTFIVGLFILMISAIIYISVRWVVRVFKYGFGERLREDQPHNRTPNPSTEMALEVQSFRLGETVSKKNNNNNHYNYGVDYEIDPDVLRERKEYEMKKKKRSIQIYAIPFTVSLVLLAVSILCNLLVYL